MIISFTKTYISVKYNPKKILLFKYWVWVLNIKTDDLAHVELTSNRCFIIRFVCVYSQRDIRICWKKFAVYNFYWYLEQFTERKMLASINWPGKSWFHFRMIKCCMIKCPLDLENSGSFLIQLVHFWWYLEYFTPTW